MGGGRFIAAVAALALLMMPVQYRAGAEAAHPHAAFQLWADFAHSKSPHRHDTNGELQHAHHDAATMSSSEPAARADSAVGIGSWVEAPPDVPRLSEATPPAERAAAFASVAALAWWLLVVGLPRFVGTDRRLVGRAPRPLFPPPRAIPVA